MNNQCNLETDLGRERGSDPGETYGVPEDIPATSTQQFIVKWSVHTQLLSKFQNYHLSFINLAKHRQKIPRMEQKYPIIMKNRMPGTNMSNNLTTQPNNIQLHVA